MPVIKFDLKERIPKKDGVIYPVDVKDDVLPKLDGFKENTLLEPIVNQNSVNLSPDAQQAEIAREMNAAAQNSNNQNVESSNVIPFFKQSQNNMTIAEMEEKPVNTATSSIVDNKDKLRILELERALATILTKIRSGMNDFDEAEQIIGSSLQGNQSQNQEETSFSKAA